MVAPARVSTYMVPLLRLQHRSDLTVKVNTRRTHRRTHTSIPPPPTRRPRSRCVVEPQTPVPDLRTQHATEPQLEVRAHLATMSNRPARALSC